MSFDTTYFINTYDETLTGTITFPGGKDTSFILQPGQLPSALDPALAGHDIAVSKFQTSLINESPDPPGYTPSGDFTLIFILIFILIIYLVWRRSEVIDTYSQTIFPNRAKAKAKTLLTYYGDELDFSDQQLSAILTQRFPYFNKLSSEYKNRFIARLQKFMSYKTFKIHGEKGYKEMPVLVSAAAIQLTFGLKKYLLPHFQFIHIHPQEFLRVRPILCFLEGNVSGHSINLSWKHFLQGYADTNDGQNVGLHELAHALYYQTFEVEENVDKNFRNFYDNFHVDGNKAYDTEKNVEGGLYSEYAEKNFQEFWAESVELFFEKPVEMKLQYPQLYQTMKSLLNQDPINHIPSMVS